MRNLKLSPAEKLQVMVEGLARLSQSMLITEEEVGPLMDLEARDQADKMKEAVVLIHGLLVKYLADTLEEEANMN